MKITIAAKKYIDFLKSHYQETENKLNNLKIIFSDVSVERNKLLLAAQQETLEFINSIRNPQDISVHIKEKMKYHFKRDYDRFSYRLFFWTWNYNRAEYKVHGAEHWLRGVDAGVDVGITEINKFESRVRTFGSSEKNTTPYWLEIHSISDFIGSDNVKKIEQFWYKDGGYDDKNTGYAQLGERIKNTKKELEKLQSTISELIRLKADDEMIELDTCSDLCPISF